MYRVNVFESGRLSGMSLCRTWAGHLRLQMGMLRGGFLTCRVAVHRTVTADVLCCCGDDCGSNTVMPCW